jgi:hypothetical protein
MIPFVLSLYFGAAFAVVAEKDARLRVALHGFMGWRKKI